MGNFSNYDGKLYSGTENRNFASLFFLLGPVECYMQLLRCIQYENSYCFDVKVLKINENSNISNEKSKGRVMHKCTLCYIVQKVVW